MVDATTPGVSRCAFHASDTTSTVAAGMAAWTRSTDSRGTGPAWLHRYVVGVVISPSFDGTCEAAGVRRKEWIESEVFTMVSARSRAPTWLGVGHHPPVSQFGAHRPEASGPLVSRA